MTVTVAGGKVHYLRRMKLADYEHKEASVELAFSADDGGYGPALEAAADEAVSRVHHMLGLVKAVAQPAVPPAVPVAPAPKRPPRPTAPPEPAPVPPEPAPAPVDGLFGAAPVTDADLGTAITTKNAAVKNPQAIKALIAQYCPQDGRVHQFRDIPPETRGAFLLDLAKVEVPQ